MNKLSALGAGILLSTQLGLTGCDTETPTPPAPSAAQSLPSNDDKARQVAPEEVRPILAFIPSQEAEQERSQMRQANGAAYEAGFDKAAQAAMKGIGRGIKDVPRAEDKAVAAFRAQVKAQHLSGPENLSAREALFTEMTVGTVTPKFTYTIDETTVNVIIDASSTCGSPSVRKKACTPKSDIFESNILDCSPEECDDGGLHDSSALTAEVIGATTTYVFKLEEGISATGLSIEFASSGGSPMLMEEISEVEPDQVRYFDEEAYVFRPFSFEYGNSYNPELSSVGTQEQAPKWPERLDKVWEYATTVRPPM